MKKIKGKILKTITILGVLILVFAMSLSALATISLEITIQPQNYVYPEGSVASYEIEAEGENLTPRSYHWYIVFGGITYDTMDIKDTDPWLRYIGEECGQYNTGNGFYFSGIQEGLNGAEIYCVVSDGEKSVTSSKAYISVSGTKMPPAKINVPAEITVPKGFLDGKYDIVCKTDNDAKNSFQWYETSSGKLQDILAIECRTSTLTIDTNKVGTSYYVCMVTTPEGGYGYSSVIPVTINESEEGEESTSGQGEPQKTTVEILSQPKDTNAKDGETVTFSCKAEGKVSYQWWRSENKTFNPDDSGNVKLSDGDGLSGTEADTLTMTASVPLSGIYFVCEITDEDGNKGYTESACLSVSPDETGAKDEGKDGAEKDGDGLSTGTIILISALAVALIAAITSIIILSVKIKKKKS